MGHGYVCCRGRLFHYIEVLMTFYSKHVKEHFDCAFASIIWLVIYSFEAILVHTNVK